jgi:hypothetical protein
LNLSNLKPRHHGLIGQSVLAEKFSFQYKSLFCVIHIDTFADLKDLEPIIIKLQDNASFYITKHFNIKEFHDLEDEDHDEDHYNTDMIVDYYDE